MAIEKHIDHGFLLTRQTIDYRGNIQVHLWIKTASGPVNLIVENETAVFFVEESQRANVRSILIHAQIPFQKIEPLSLKTFQQQAVCGVYFKKLQDFYKARDLLSQHKVKCYEDDFRPEERYLMERFITAHVQFSGLKTREKSYSQYQQVKCKALEHKQQSEAPSYELSMVSLDIECSMQGELYSIGLYANDLKLVFMIGQPKNSAETQHEFIEWVENEAHLLQSLLTWFEQYNPDIIIGWNVINFDFNLLQKRYDLYGLAFSIGRDNSQPRWRTNSNSQQKFIDIAGRVVLDGIDLLKTATYNFPSFSLDNVANTLLGIGKKVDDVDNRVQEITDNFLHNKIALAEYNLEDCRLVTLIFEKTQLLEFAMLRAELTGLNIDRPGGSVAAFTNLYLPRLHRSGYVAPNMGDGESSLVSPGGYVMDSIPGLYQHVLVLDFKSLYPSIIRTFNIDPMGLIEGLRDKEKNNESPIEGFDGAYFSRNQHFLPDIITRLWQARDRAKAEKNEPLSQAIKIIMNSFYGVLGSTGCRFFDPRLSGSITKRSHALLKQTKKWIEEKGYQVIYGDTDSIFVSIGDNVSQEQAKVLGLTLQTFINDELSSLIEKQFNVSSKLEIEFETHFSPFLMPTIRGAALQAQSANMGTKKRYAGQIIKNGKPALVFKGMETVRSDWTELSKIFQQALYKRIFNQQSVEEYVRETVEKIYLGEFDHLLLYRKRLRRKLHEYVKNVPPHVKAARIGDQLNEKNNRPLTYQNKGWIEYFITVDGPQPKEYCTSLLDYDFYVDRQIKAIADDILPYIGTSFSQIVDKQLGLF